eukprot:jgi/Ulvmu1/4595/UM002_0324.1
MPVRRAVQVGLELMRAVQCMHEAGFCHGDIKSANVLLTSKAVSATSAGVKLADMGLCRRMGSSVSEMDGGSLPFIPPELQLGLEDTAKPSQDIFACGVVMLDLACTHKPYEDLSVRDFDAAVKNGTLYARMSVPLAEFRNEVAFCEFADIFFEMVSHDPELRPTAAQAVLRLQAMADALDGRKEATRAMTLHTSDGPEINNWLYPSGPAAFPAGAPGSHVAEVPLQPEYGSITVTAASDQDGHASLLEENGVSNLMSNSTAETLPAEEAYCATALCSPQGQHDSVTSMSEGEEQGHSAVEACRPGMEHLLSGLLQEQSEMPHAAAADMQAAALQSECTRRQKGHPCGLPETTTGLGAWPDLTECTHVATAAFTGLSDGPYVQRSASPPGTFAGFTRQSGPGSLVQHAGVGDASWSAPHSMSSTGRCEGSGLTGDPGMGLWPGMRDSFMGLATPMQRPPQAIYAGWGWEMNEVQTTVQLGWASSRLEELSARNAISQVYDDPLQGLLMNGGGQVTDVRSTGVVPAQKGGICAGSGAAWSPW